MSTQRTLRSLLLRGDVLEWHSHGDIHPMHKPYSLPLILSLDGLLTLAGLFEDKEDETKDWSVEKLFSEAKDSVTALRSHFPFNAVQRGVITMKRKRLFIPVMFGTALSVVSTLSEANSKLIHVRAKIVQQAFIGDPTNPQLGDRVITNVDLFDNRSTKVGTGAGVCTRSPPYSPSP